MISIHPPKTLDILLDCDCVMADLIRECLDVLEEHTGERYLNESVSNAWDISTSVGHPELTHIVRKTIDEPGFCLRLRPVPGSVDAVETLKKYGELYVLTAPNYRSQTWVPERLRWLQEHFGIHENDVVFGMKKHIVRGDVLIDDSAKHIQRWAKKNPDGLGVIWSGNMGQKVGDNEMSSNVVECFTWDEVIREIDTFRRGY
jgi:5'(3')-deoxyribonucleotidase